MDRNYKKSILLVLYIIEQAIKNYHNDLKKKVYNQKLAV